MSVRVRLTSLRKALTPTVVSALVSVTVTGGIWSSDWSTPTRLLLSALVLVGLALLYLIGALHLDEPTRSTEAFRRELRAEVRRRSAERLPALTPASLPNDLAIDVAAVPEAIRFRRLSDRVVDESSSLDAAFRASDQSILVLGDKGSGKTYAAYGLVDDLTRAGSGDVLVVDASSWTDEHPNLDRFLIDYVANNYQVGVPAVARWLDESDVVLVVDGLDELGSNEAAESVELRRALVEQLRSWPGGLVLTCRTAEWNELDESAPTRHAIEILPLSEDQVERVVRALGVEPSDAPDWLLDVVGTPLFASLTLSTGIDFLPSEGVDSELATKLVAERFVSMQLRDADPGAEEFLGWIAAFMSGEDHSRWDHRSPDRSVFAAWHLTPMEPPDSVVRWSSAAMALAGGACTFVVLWMVRDEVFSQWTNGALFALLFAAVFGILIQVGAAGSAVDDGSARPATAKVSVRPSRLAYDLARPGLLGLALGVFGAALSPYWTDLWNEPGFTREGRIEMATLWTVIGLMVGVRANVLQSDVPVAGQSFDAPARASLRSVALDVCLLALVGALIGVAFNWQAPRPYAITNGVLVGATTGLVASLGSGGWFLTLQTLTLRSLRERGHLPRELAEFLSDMEQRGLLRSTGMGYRFRHDVIQQVLTPERA